MSLPKINEPEYTLVVPSTDEQIKFRPFLVKEEKFLLMAQEVGADEALYSAIKTLIKNCTLDKIDVDNLPLFDIEYIFLNIRAKSVGEVSKLKLICPDDKKTTADVEIDLNDVQVQVDENHTNKIELEKGMGMVMTYPTIDSLKGLGIQTINATNMIDVIGTCILQIYENEGEKVYEAGDQTKKELSDFIEQLQTKHFKKVQAFFDTMPKLKHTIKIKNPKTKKTSEITLTGLNDFFA